jgi:hypothetical protein
VHDPSLSHRRPRLGCFAGTFSPSRRQMRSTRFLFTVQGPRPAIALLRCARQAGEYTQGYAQMVQARRSNVAPLPAWRKNCTQSRISTFSLLLHLLSDS